jgi:hypothetical protein
VSCGYRGRPLIFNPTSSTSAYTEPQKFTVAQSGYALQWGFVVNGNCTINPAGLGRPQRGDGHHHEHRSGGHSGKSGFLHHRYSDSMPNGIGDSITATCTATFTS